MTDSERLRVVLLALLPADGSAIPRASLAKAAGLNRGQVAVILDEDIRAGRAAYELVADSYRAVKQGGAL